METEYLTPAEVAKMLKVSQKTVLRMFADRPGVVHLGHSSRMNRRRYRLIRIPRSVLTQFLAERGGG